MMTKEKQPVTHTQQISKFGNLVIYEGNPSVAYSNAITPEEFLSDLERYSQLRQERNELRLGLMGNPLTRAEVAVVFRAKNKLAAGTRLFNKKVLESLSLAKGSDGCLYLR